MNQPKKKIINVAKILAPIVSSRDLTGNFKDMILESTAKTVSLDFAEVEFVSRSAAHEFLTIKDELIKKKEVIFINTNKSVTEMFRVVAANRAVPKKNKVEFKAKNIDINSLAGTMR